jgi:hypothetical protein
LAAAIHIGGMQQKSSSCDFILVWHGKDSNVLGFLSTLPVRVVYRDDFLIERLIAGEIPLSQRSLMVRAIYSLWWKTQRFRKILVHENIDVAKFSFAKRNFLVAGYFHDYPHVPSIIEVATKWLESRDSIVDEIAMDRLFLEDCIGVHLRFGDYLSVENRKNLGELSQRYYAEALSRFRSSDSKLKIIVFTDNVDAASVKLSSIPNIEITFASDYCNGPYEEFCLLTSLSAKILSNSTFSWWAGYLSNGRDVVISPLPMSLEQIGGLACSPNFTYVETEYLT